jgi:ubiquitin-conjugating enzyme E2 J2
MSKAAQKRLTKEYLAFQKSPPPFLIARPLESNILEWHYVLTGPPDTPYDQGQYHGKLIFPSDYPFKPPSIMIITPNGRFQTDTRICLSMSDYHRKESINHSCKLESKLVSCYNLEWITVIYGFK